MLPGVRKEIANQTKCDPWIERLQLIWTLGQISFLRFVQKSTVVQIALAVSRLRLQSTPAAFVVRIINASGFSFIKYAM